MSQPSTLTSPSSHGVTPRLPLDKEHLIDFGRRLWRVVLTGLTYGVFKVGAGMAAWEDIHPAVGLAFMLWGITDAVLNLLYLLAPRRLSYCLLSNIGRALDERRGCGHLEAVGQAVDTLLAFSIVATMIGFGRIASLPWPALPAWEISVIANVLGAGLERLHTAIKTPPDRPCNKSKQQ